MNKKAKQEIGSILSLIERMDNKKCFFDALENKKQLIKEVMSKASKRRQVTRDEIFDILDHGGIQDGYFVSLTYVCPPSTPPLKNKVWRGERNWDEKKVADALNKHMDKSEKDWHKQLTDFNDENTTLKKNPLGNASILTVQQYLFNWQGSTEKYNQAYSKYQEQLSNLRMKYGVGLHSNGMLGDNHNQREKIMGGGQFNQTGNISKDFNFAGVKPKTTVYFIDDDGNIGEELPAEVLRAMTKYSDGIEKDIKSMLTPEQIEEYKKEKKELQKNFIGRNLKYDGLLSIVAHTKNGEDVFFINDMLSPSKIKVNQDAFTKLAQEQLGASFDAIHGFEK